MGGRRSSVPDGPALAAVILCGGRSSRFGTDKALFRFEGEPLALRVARLVSEVAEPVILASGTSGRLRRALGALTLPEVEDARVVPADRAPAGLGPMAGLVAGLEASPHPLVAAVAGDMPFASARVLRLLADRIEGHDAAVPVTAQGPQPLHAVYAREAAAALRAALQAGRRAVRDALRGLQVLTIEPVEWGAADPAGRFAWNVNRPEDLTPLDPRPTGSPLRR